MIFLLVISVVTALATALWPDWTASLVFSACLLVPFLYWTRKAVPTEDRTYLTRVVILAFALRVGCAYLVEALRLVDKQDALVYHTIGHLIALDLQHGRFQELIVSMGLFSHPGYYVLVGVVYFFFGPNILLGQNLNALASAFTVVPIYFLCREISLQPRAARLAAMAFAWFPNSIFWSTQLLKDSIVVLLEVALILDLVRILKGRFSTGTILRLILSTVVLAEFRFYLPVIVYGSCALAYFATAWQARGVRRGTTAVFVGAVLVTVLIAIVLTPTGWTSYLAVGEWYRLEGLNPLQGMREASMGGDSDFARGTRLHSPADFLKFLPIGLAHFLAGPLPWEARKLSHYLTWLDIPIWYPALALGFAGMVMLFRRRQAIPLMSIALGLTLCYSLLQANLGTAYRMRLQVTPFFLIAAACYWYRSKENAPRLDVSGTATNALDH